MLIFICEISKEFRKMIDSESVSSESAQVDVDIDKETCSVRREPEYWGRGHGGLCVRGHQGPGERAVRLLPGRGWQVAPGMWGGGPPLSVRLWHQRQQPKCEIDSPYVHERKIVINHTTDRMGSGGNALQMLTSVVTEGSSDRLRLWDLRLTRTAFSFN